MGFSNRIEITGKKYFLEKYNNFEFKLRLSYHVMPLLSLNTDVNPIWFDRYLFFTINVLQHTSSWLHQQLIRSIFSTCQIGKKLKMQFYVMYLITCKMLVKLAPERITECRKVSSVQIYKYSPDHGDQGILVRYHYFNKKKRNKILIHFWYQIFWCSKVACLVYCYIGCIKL